jgi:hypothetical protein
MEMSRVESLVEEKAGRRGQTEIRDAERTDWIESFCTASRTATRYGGRGDK